MRSAPSKTPARRRDFRASGMVVAESPWKLCDAHPPPRTWTCLKQSSEPPNYAIISLDKCNRVLTWNAGAEALFGWHADEIRDQSGAAIFTPEDQEKDAPEQELALARTHGRAEDERWHLRKDGSRFWGSGVIVPLKPEAPPGFVKSSAIAPGNGRPPSRCAKASNAFAAWLRIFRSWSGVPIAWSYTGEERGPWVAGSYSSR
jgi:PAS domain S-box-containing protein